MPIFCRSRLGHAAGPDGGAGEKNRVSVTSLCIASGVPPTTALRWIGQMTEAGLLKRIEDETDRRRAFITLTDKAVEAMAAYFAELGNTVHRVI
jgi:DNA-binding MarR family transcriptional regulator